MCGQSLQATHVVARWRRRYVGIKIEARGNPDIAEPLYVDTLLVLVPRPLHICCSMEFIQNFILQAANIWGVGTRLGTIVKIMTVY